MPITLDTIPSERKLALIAAGEEFGSDDTYAQATQTLQGEAKYANTLRLYGFPPSDFTRLKEAQDLLSTSGFGRNQSKSKKKALSVGLDDAEKVARTARLRGRSVLTSARAALLDQGTSVPATAAQAVLDTTADSEKTGDELAQQLDQLADAIDPSKSPEVAAAAADRGGPETLPAIQNAATSLRDAVKKKPALRGTPEDTQRLDLVDGIILDICRRARDAAEAASKDLGDPAILKTFKLDKLYPSKNGKKDEKPAEDTAAPAAAAPSPAAAATTSPAAGTGTKTS